MPDFFILCVVLVVAYFYTGLIYLFYLPLKLWLESTNRLSTKWSKRINWTFICLPILYCFYFYLNKSDRLDKGDRISSKERLENISKIKLPKNFKVLKDEYQDIWQDYCILYNIQFDNKASKELADRIKKSVYYNPNSSHNGVWEDKDLIAIDSIRAVWIRTPKGFYFNKPYGGTFYRISFDTLSNKLSYEECTD